MNTNSRKYRLFALQQHAHTHLSQVNFVFTQYYKSALRGFTANNTMDPLTQDLRRTQEAIKQRDGGHERIETSEDPKGTRVANNIHNSVAET